MDLANLLTSVKNGLVTVKEALSALKTLIIVLFFFASLFGVTMPNAATNLRDKAFDAIDLVLAIDLTNQHQLDGQDLL